MLRVFWFSSNFSHTFLVAGMEVKIKMQKDHVPHVDGEVYSSAEINLTLEKLCAVD